MARAYALEELLDEEEVTGGGTVAGTLIGVYVAGGVVQEPRPRKPAQCKSKEHASSIQACTGHFILFSVPDHNCILTCRHRMPGAGDPERLNTVHRQVLKL